MIYDCNYRTNNDVNVFEENKYTSNRVLEPLEAELLLH